VRVSVADGGLGIAPEKLARLFQPFERLGAELGGVQGTGIGLALSKQLAELMGATLGAESRVGVGSTFWIDLPPADGRRAQAEAPAPAPQVLAARPFDLLYIEDNRSNIELITAFFAARPHVRLHTAASGEAGLALAAAEPPDIVLLDIHLPGIDGHEVLRRLRADPRLGAIPVIALSADAMLHDIQRGLAAGFDRYIAKPVDLNELRDVLDDLLRRRGPSGPAR
jgi:CheY-like chemotaxis protein